MEAYVHETRVRSDRVSFWSLAVILLLTATSACGDAEFRLTHARPQLEIAEKVIAKYGPADVTAASEDGSRELTIALKRDSYSGLPTAEKRRIAREVAEYVRPMLTPDEFDAIKVSFVEAHTEGLIERSRTRTFTFAAQQTAR